MARPTPGRAQFHYLESWLLPSLGLRATVFHFNPGYERDQDYYLDVGALRARRHRVARRGPLPGSRRAHRRRTSSLSDVDELLTAVRHGLLTPEAARTGGADRGRRDRRPGPARLPPRTLAGGPRNGPDLAGSVMSAAMSSTKRGWIVAAVAALLLSGTPFGAGRRAGRPGHSAAGARRHAAERRRAGATTRGTGSRPRPRPVQRDLPGARRRCLARRDDLVQDLRRPRSTPPIRRWCPAVPSRPPAWCRPLRPGRHAGVHPVAVLREPALRDPGERPDHRRGRPVRRATPHPAAQRSRLRRAQLRFGDQLPHRQHRAERPRRRTRRPSIRMRPRNPRRLPPRHSSRAASRFHRPTPMRGGRHRRTTAPWRRRSHPSSRGPRPPRCA